MSSLSARGPGATRRPAPIDRSAAPCSARSTGRRRCRGSTDGGAARRVSRGDERQRRPVGGDRFVGRHDDLGHHRVGDECEQLVLRPHVVVQRHRSGAELGRDAAHRDGSMPSSSAMHVDRRRSRRANRGRRRGARRVSTRRERADEACRSARRVRVQRSLFGRLLRSSRPRFGVRDELRSVLADLGGDRSTTKLATPR